jgi:quinol monooxygenase YgiN
VSETLRVIAVIPTDPAADEAIAAGVAELVAATLAEEGCIAYEAYRSTAVPGVWVTIEEWRNQADLDAHMQTPHIAKAFEVLGPALAGEVGIHPLSPV